MRRRSHFSNCYNRGRRFFSKNFTFFVVAQEDTDASWRIGQAVSRKFGSAVRRNRLKRLVREFFRLHQYDFVVHADIVVVPKRGINVESMNLDAITSEFTPLMKHIVASTSP